ncbi:MAG: sulfatase-like hydrolase/transferase [Burkholderiaceae bacterium]|nr:sulfatase-like hydrolase/transferase [Burkholderiaceae bacterium]
MADQLGGTTRRVRNVLFIMADQLRADYLSCYGHRALRTPNLDALAAMGTRFTRAYCQAPVCGPSRMSFYTGRYTLSHGATWNFVQLPVGERTLGDYLRPLGVRTAVVGKTHHRADLEGIARLGLSPDTGTGALLAQGGFEPYWRDDGLHPDHKVKPDLEYNVFLRSRGYDGFNPWHEWANSGQDENGELASGWYMRNAHRPTRLPEEFTETPFATNKAIEFIREQGEQPWCLHLSYIKPHWPYIAPAPYHDMFGPDDFQAPIRADSERSEQAGGRARDINPILAGFQQHPESLAFSDDRLRENMLPAYMGLVKQIDDHVGRLMRFLKESGRLEDTMIVFTADHGDFLGDHWQGEKEFMYEPSVRLPMIVYDPDPAAPRGEVRDDLIEAVDLVPTFIDAIGGEVATHVIEGRSLLGLLRGGKAPQRDAVFAEMDYSIYPTARRLGIGQHDARMVMARSERYKLVHVCKGVAPLLWDLQEDPHELVDLGRDPGYAGIVDAHYAMIFDWMIHRRNRIAISDADIAARPSPADAGGVIIGKW